MALDFEAIWGALPIPCVVINSELLLEAMNNAAEVFLGSSSRNLSGRSLASVSGETSIAVEMVAQALDRNISVVQHDVEIAWLDRSFRVGALQAMGIGPDGQNVLLMMVVRGLPEKMDKTLGYQTAARSVTGMAMMLAHEIRNPLAGIKGAAQLLAMNLPQADQELTTLIEEEALRIGQLVDRVEHFGDLRPTVRRPVNIHDVLRRAVTSARAGYARHVRINEIYDPSLPPTAADQDQLIQVFQNLLKNAAEAVPEIGGVISVHTAFRPGVRLSLPGGKGEGLPLEILIIDNGIGVSDDLANHLFEPFVSSKANGSGLGLSLVSKVLADHGGVVEYERTDAKTVFRVLLPVWVEPKNAQQPLEGVS